VFDDPISDRAYLTTYKNQPDHQSVISTKNHKSLT